MARKPNYKFERFERDRAKAAKKAARAQAKAERKKAAEDGEAAPGEITTLDEGTPSDESADGPADAGT